MGKTLDIEHGGLNHWKVVHYFDEQIVRKL